MSNDFIAGPGQFWVLGGWAMVVVAFFLYISWKLGRIIHAESDGCLLMFANFALVIIGGMVGLRFFHFPYNLLSSMFLSIFLPGVLTIRWVRRTLPPRRP